jgi:hypothetical protein
LQSAYTKAREEDEALDLKTFSGKLGIDWNNVPFLCLVKRYFYWALEFYFKINNNNNNQGTKCDV